MFLRQVELGCDQALGNIEIDYAAAGMVGFHFA